MAQATQQHQTIQSDRQEDESQYNAHCRSLPRPGTGRATSPRPWRTPRHVFHRLRAQSLMFDSLSQRLARIVKTMRGEARLTEANTQEMLREIRIALLEADVALPVVRDFIAQVKEKALGQEVLQSLTPGQALVGIVHNAMVDLIGGETAELDLASQPPAIILMAGLQGAGKTTTVGKISKWLRENRKKKVLTVSCDVYRPAANYQDRKSVV